MNATAFRPRAIAQAEQSRTWPKVSLHLPLRDAAPEAVRRTLESVAALDYPALELLVIDTHTADPACWEAAAEYCALLGPQARFFHLGAFPGFRAGALNFALSETARDATLVGVLKAGQTVRPDWLRAAVPLLAQDGTGLVQAPVLPLDDAADAGLSLPLDGLTLFRLEALRHAGGWDAGSLCPEAELGITLMQHGWDKQTLSAPMGQQVPDGSAGDVASRRHRRVAGTVAALCKRPGALLPFRDRSLTASQRHGLLRTALLPLLDAVSLAAVVLSLFMATLTLWDEDWTQPLPAMLGAGVFALLPLLRGGPGRTWRDGRAAWQGLLGGQSSRADGLGLERFLVGALGLAALGVAAARPWGAGPTLLVVIVLLAEAAPGVVALWPARRASRVAARRRHVA